MSLFRQKPKSPEVAPVTPATSMLAEKTGTSPSRPNDLCLELLDVDGDVDINLTWSPPTKHGEAVSGYQVQVSNTESRNKETFTVTTCEFTYRAQQAEIPALSFRVRAMAKGGLGEYTHPIQPLSAAPVNAWRNEQVDLIPEVLALIRRVSPGLEPDEDLGMVADIVRITRSIQAPDDDGWNGVIAQAAAALDQEAQEVGGQRGMVLRCAALGMRWPEYDLGSGYWDTALSIGQSLAEEGLTLPPEEFARLWSMREILGVPGFECLALGYAAGRNASSEDLREIIESFSIPQDCVKLTIVAAANPRTPEDCLRPAFLQLQGYADQMPEFLMRTYNDCGHESDSAMEVASQSAQRSAGFWRELLDPEGFNGLQRVDDDYGIEPERYEGVLEDLAALLRTDPTLRKFARECDWQPAVELSRLIGRAPEIEPRSELGRTAEEQQNSRRIMLELPDAERE